jgi:hypothetical protein
MFDPKAHLIQLPRRVKEPVTGHFTTRYDDYLEVKYRVLMFREKYPHGILTTEEVCVDLERGYARYKAMVEDGEGGKATGYGTETTADFTDYAERAETRAVGPALALLGFGTQFVGQDLSEGEHVADAPVQGDRSSAPTPPPLPAGEGPSPGPAQGHPSADEITKLVDTVRAVNVDLEAFGHDMRRLMQLPDSQKITKKFLRERMTLDQYNKALAHYGEALRQVIEEDVPTHEPPSQAVDADASQVVHAPTAEGLPVDPSVGTSSSAPDRNQDAAAERDRQRLRAEVATWNLRVTPEEIEHVIQHNPYSKARALLWKCRRAEPAPPIETSAAD